MNLRSMFSSSFPSASASALILLSANALCAQINLSADVDNPNPNLGERVTYTITLTSASTSAPDIIPPDFDGFDIVMGPSSSTSIQMVNANITTAKTLTYILRPNRSGSLTIPPAQVKYKGVKQSNSVTVVVGQPTSSQEEPDDAQSPKSSRRQTSRPNEALPRSDRGELPDVFVSVSADKTTLYKLDMALVTYKLYLRVNVSNYNFARLPQATGFWQEVFEVSQRPTLQDVSVRGVAYKVATIRKVGLFPTRAGTLTLDPLTCDITVERPISRRSRDPFDMFFDDPFFGSRMQRQVVSSTTEPLTFTVLELLPADRPSDFRGDVGDYQIKVTCDKRELNQNDALTLKINISGTGYLKSIEAPKLELPSGFDQFPPTVEDKITLVGESMRGRKTFTYLVIPRRTGRFDLAPVSFSYFNPDSKTYKTMHSGAIEVYVNPSQGGGESARLFTSSEVNIMDSDIRFIKSPAGALTRINLPLYKTNVYYFLLALPPFLFLLGLGFEKVQEIRQSDPLAVRRRKAAQNMAKALKAAEALAQQGKAVASVETATRGLIELVGAVIDEPAASLTSEIAQQRLRERNADETFIVEILRLWTESDRVRFAGATVDTKVINNIIECYSTAADKLARMV
ncbi:MAG: protein BatD [Calditrichaeota bacterium]|nr:protein BatD [Calditrichota bacterium]